MAEKLTYDVTIVSANALKDGGFDCDISPQIAENDCKITGIFAATRPQIGQALQIVLEVDPETQRTSVVSIKPIDSGTGEQQAAA
ncbi:MAG: hypothetical protein V2A63_03795 [Patescibacteria group bacterium]